MAENEKEEYAPLMVAEPSNGMAGKISCCNINMANNGFIVRFDIRTKRPGASDSEHCDYQTKTFLFEQDKEDEAWEYYKQMKMREMKGS